MIIDGIFMNKDGKIILSNKAAEELANEIAYCATEAKDHGYSGYVQLFYKKRRSCCQGTNNSGYSSGLTLFLVIKSFRSFSDPSSFFREFFLSVIFSTSAIR